MSHRVWVPTLLVIAACRAPAPLDAPSPAGRAEVPAPLTIVASAVEEPPASREERIVARARGEVRARVHYDPSYVALTFRDGVDTGRAVYPDGDLDAGHGVCTDVVIRALRAGGVDLQRRVHEDILKRPTAYALARKPDVNIDHRRVGPLLTYLRGNARSLPKGFDGADRESWRAGDIVVWAFRECPRCSPDHIGIVGDRPGPRGLPRILHNVGPVPTEDDVLDRWTVLGHFRIEG